MRSLTIRPKGGKFLLEIFADGVKRTYTYTTFAGAYKRAKRLCDFLDLEESAIKHQKCTENTVNKR